MSQQDLLDKVKENSVYPDDLMTDISRSSLVKTLGWSVLIHAVVILVTSIGFISLAMRYDSWNPQVVVERQQAEERAAAEALKEADAAAQQQQQSQTTSPGQTGTPAAGAADGLSPIERELMEVDRNFPTGSSTGFGAPTSLDE